ncbi:extracellular solute-binding protein [Thermotoga sp. Mc24]|uniref:ABC transporter substrate-binding protein n=1 Tax=Thermotoga sp. Mc24 TaxID=1231241 RepID=UPI000542E0C4|nr:ABC transporter substrate-binding protein [Thermotoga sp. Mc24]KHC91491.1 extracellular solute-binding protein [Thermotoga sp. Mc24]
MKRFLVVLVLILALVSVFGQSFERNKTLYWGGALWSPPSNWNPFTPWNAVAGTIGLVYEPLFLYDPLNDKFEPWLAEKGEWASDNEYVLTLRKGLRWQDGVPLTADDVVFTFEIAKKYTGISYSPVWNWLDRIERVDERTLKFIFSDPRYQEWKQMLINTPIVPKHIWENKTEEEVLQAANEYPVGSGPYYVESWADDRCVFKKNENWWGIRELGYNPKPERIVELRVLSNNVAVGMLMKGELDWSNFFLPGVPVLKKAYGIVTWYENAPYMLPANTAGIFVNVNKYPLSIPEFRRAMAYAINPEKIVTRAYENMVTAANPAGILPLPGYMKYYPKDVVDMYGFKYDPEMAKKILDELGFKDVNKDGFREDPNGKPFKLTIECPYGWTDWMVSIQSIAEDLVKVGINVEPKYPDYSKYADDLYGGKFDLILNNFVTGVSATIWSYFNGVFYPDAAESEYSYSGNFGKYANPEVESLLDELNRSKDDAKIKEVVAKLSEILLKDLPFIPLWYNGAWFQASKAVWTNWPTEKNPYAVPIGWNGWWQLTGIKTLFGIEAK